MIKSFNVEMVSE